MKNKSMDSSASAAGGANGGGDGGIFSEEEASRKREKKQHGVLHLISIMWQYRKWRFNRLSTLPNVISFMGGSKKQTV